MWGRQVFIFRCEHCNLVANKENNLFKQKKEIFLQTLECIYASSLTDLFQLLSSALSSLPPSFPSLKLFLHITSTSAPAESITLTACRTRMDVCLRGGGAEAAGVQGSIFCLQILTTLNPIKYLTTQTNLVVTRQG